MTNTGLKTVAINIDGSMFKRSGAWFGLFQRGSSYGDISLYLGTLHGISAKAAEKNKMIDVFPTFNGRKVPFTVKAVPSELTLTTSHGDVRFTFADLTKLVAEGDPGMGLLFEKNMVRHESVHPRKGGAWEAVFRFSSCFIFKGLEGSTFDFNNGENYWNWENLSSDKVCGRTHPGPDNRFTLVMEEFAYGGIVRDAYPTYLEARTSMQADWEAFISKMPRFIEPFEHKRLECEYTTWSFLQSPYGTARFPMIQMFAGITGSQWQMCQNAVALQEHLALAVDMLLGPLDRISAEGQLADGYDDAACETQMIKPPVHGWAIKQIMKNHDLIKECPREKIEILYTGIGAWGDWFMNYRDEDEDGLPTFVHGDETGLDDSTMFLDHIRITSPDLSAYLVILFEAVGDLAKLLMKPEAETNAWYEKSESLLKRLVDNLWDGEHFIGLVPDSGERVFSGSIVHYMPAILGSRLPRDIIDKMADDLSDKEKFLSPWGLASEDMTSDYFCPSPGSIGRGCVVPPAMIFICTGLWETHRKNNARIFAENYCNALSNSGFPFLINPQNGMGSGYFGGSWPRCAYEILGRMLSEDK